MHARGGDGEEGGACGGGCAVLGGSATGARRPESRPAPPIARAGRPGRRTCRAHVLRQLRRALGLEPVCNVPSPAETATVAKFQLRNELLAHHGGCYVTHFSAGLEDVREREARVCFEVQCRCFDENRNHDAEWCAQRKSVKSCVHERSNCIKGAA